MGSPWQVLLRGTRNGVIAGFVGTVAMTVSERAEQAITGRASPDTPARTLERFLGLSTKQDHRRRWFSLFARLGLGTFPAALLGIMAERGMRGPAASAMFFATRMTTDETLDNVAGADGPTWWRPTESTVLGTLHKAVYALVSGLVADRLAEASPSRAQLGGGHAPRGSRAQPVTDPGGHGESAVTDQRRYPVSDVFDVLRNDHVQLKAILTLLLAGSPDEYTLSQRLVAAASRHERAEEMHFWPTVRIKVKGGNALADAAIFQEGKGKQILDQLRRTRPGSQKFDELLIRFAAAGQAHMAYEESEVWPALESALNASERSELGERLEQAEKAPAQPHSQIHSRPAALAMANAAGDGGQGD